MKQLKLNNVSAKMALKPYQWNQCSVSFLHCRAAPPRGSARNCLKAISKTRMWGTPLLQDPRAHSICRSQAYSVSFPLLIFLGRKYECTGKEGSMEKTSLWFLRLNHEENSTAEESRQYERCLEECNSVCFNIRCSPEMNPRSWYLWGRPKGADQRLGSRKH